MCTLLPFKTLDFRVNQRASPNSLGGAPHCPFTINNSRNNMEYYDKNI